MTAAVLGVALAACVMCGACGGAPSNGKDPGASRPDPNLRDPSGGRSDNYAPAREAERWHHTGKGK